MQAGQRRPLELELLLDLGEVRRGQVAAVRARLLGERAPLLLRDEKPPSVLDHALDDGAELVDSLVGLVQREVA